MDINTNNLSDEELINSDEEFNLDDEEELDDETRNIVFNTKLKDIDSLYNTKIKKKNNCAKNSQVKKNILDLKLKRHFNPRLPPWDNRLIKNNKNNKLDINNKNMFPSL